MPRPHHNNGQYTTGTKPQYNLSADSQPKQPNPSQGGPPLTYAKSTQEQGGTRQGGPKSK